jgi:hypothetical protein
LIGNAVYLQSPVTVLPEFEKTDRSFSIGFPQNKHFPAHLSDMLSVINTHSVEMHSSLRNRLTNREEIALAIAKPRGELADTSS